MAEPALKTVELIKIYRVSAGAFKGKKPLRAVNGVSLTVSDLLGEEGVQIGIIPFTWEHTNLGGLAPGDPVNVEADLIGKYVGRLLAPHQAPRQG